MDDDNARRASAPRVFGKVVKREVEDRPLSDKANAERSGVRARPGVVNSEEYEARVGAGKIIEDANARAEQIIEKAKTDRDAIFEKAREEARAEVTAQSSAEIAKAKMQAGMIIASAEKDIVELALTIANKVVGKDLERSPQLILEICAKAIETARNAKALVLRVNPTDGAMLREKRPQLMELVGRSIDLVIKDDAEIAQGGCILQTEFGTIDAQLSTQFEMLKNVLSADREGKP